VPEHPCLAQLVVHEDPHLEAVVLDEPQHRPRAARAVGERPQRRVLVPRAHVPVAGDQGGAFLETLDDVKKRRPNLPLPIAIPQLADGVGEPNHRQLNSPFRHRVLGPTLCRGDCRRPPEEGHGGFEP